jgi:hypothetical protein
MSKEHVVSSNQHMLIRQEARYVKEKERAKEQGRSIANGKEKRREGRRRRRARRRRSSAHAGPNKIGALFRFLH